jgi:hypothetical protein
MKIKITKLNFNCLIRYFFYSSRIDKKNKISGVNAMSAKPLLFMYLHHGIWLC